MCSTDCAYDNSTIILIGDVYCPNIKCSGRLCLHKKTFESLGRSDYQCPQCGSVCQVRNIPFEDQINSFFLSLGQGVYIFKERSKSVQEVIGDVYCPTCRNEKCVYISTNKTTSFYDCKKCKACCHVLNIPFKDQKPTIMLFGGDGTHCFAKKTSRDYEKEQPSPFLKKFLRQSQPSTSEPEPKKAKNESKYGINVSVSYWLMS